MVDSWYSISCWYHNRKGPSFVVELREGEGVFFGARQSESDGPIPSIREHGRIDPKLPRSEFQAPRGVVLPVLEQLAVQPLLILPPLGGGFDGANYHLRVRNGENQVHITWWLSCPVQWEPLHGVWEQLVGLSGT